MKKPTNLRNIQQLAGRVAALSRLITRLGEKALSFYALMKKSEKFEWTDKADQAFEDLKWVVSTPTVLVASKEKETLYLYIAATNQVVSIALVVERPEEGKVYRVFMTARKLSHYFLEHPIVVVNEAPLSNILNNPEATDVCPFKE
jgi:dsDNA-binding SOS-regulon protein